MSKTPWNQEHQTDERQQLREWIAETFLGIIGGGKKTIFSLTSAECNCVKTFERKEYFPRASFVTTEAMRGTFENIEHPKVEKHGGKVAQFIRNRGGTRSIDAAWLDYTCYFNDRMAKEIAGFIDGFFSGGKHALALTFVACGPKPAQMLEDIRGYIQGPHEVDLVEHRVEEDKDEKKIKMQFLIFEIRPAG